MHNKEDPMKDQDIAEKLYLKNSLLDNQEVQQLICKEHPPDNLSIKIFKISFYISQ